MNDIQKLCKSILDEFGIEVKDENDIQGAWLVVERMHELGHCFTLQSIVPSSDPIIYQARFTSGFAFSEYTAPMAICYTALSVIRRLHDKS